MMLKWLFVLSLFTVKNLSAQDMKITVSVGSQKITVTLDDDNSDKILPLNASQLQSTKSELMVCNLSWKADADMNRKFMLYKEDDTPVADLQPTEKKGVYTLPFTAILNNSGHADTLDLYTMATPKDPAKAAVVKVRRVLVCKIKLQ